MHRHRMVRVALLLAAGALAAVAVARVALLAGERADLLETARELGVDRAALVETVRRAEDPARARVAVARALVLEALGEDAAPGDGREPRRARLEAADRLARTVLAERPASWEAATLAGAATYLAWSLDRDPRLLQEHRAWEEPLLLAHRLAPRKPDPERYLATAYLELWPALSPAKRELARELAGEALRDRKTFGRLIGPWLEISGGDLSPVPDADWAWQGLQRALAQRRDWQGFCHAWEAGRRALQARMEDQIDGAGRRLRAGQLLAARQALLDVAASVPTDRAFAQPLERALRSAPHGPGRATLRPRLARWLLWSLDLALRGEAPLSPATLGRLRAVVTGDGTGDPALLAAAAWTHLAADDLLAAERAEGRSRGLWSAPWGPYWIEKARYLAERAAPGRAAESLAAVHPDWRDHPAYWRVRQSVAESAGDRAAAAEARAALDRLSASRWPPLGWSWRSGRARLEPLVEAGGDGLSVVLAEAPSGGGALALSWDGEVLGCHPAASGETFTHRFPVTAGLHLLELDTLASAGGRLWPGPVAVVRDGS